jgi:ABC-type glycerol-3-phosphate transport system permease component
MKRSRARPILKYAILVVYAIFSLLPFAWMLSASLKPVEEVLEIPIEWIPSSFHWNNYYEAMFEPRFGDIRMWDYMLNSIAVALITAGFTIVLSILVGYGFAKYRFRGRNIMMWGMLSTTLLPFSAALIPMILIARQLGLIDSLWALIIPFALTGQSIFLARQFIIGIPDEYMDAARVDGANEIQIFVRIVLPLLQPAIATLGVMAFTLSWMQFLWPLVSQSSQGNFTLPVGLSLMGQGSLYEVNYHLWMASAVMAVIPPLIFFLALEKAYMRGLETLSGLKG